MKNIFHIVKEWGLPPRLFHCTVYLFKLVRLFSKNSFRSLNATRALKDRHLGERCFILGGGSSVKNQDLKMLQGEHVLSVSNTFVHPDYSLIHPRYHVLPSVLGSHGSLYQKENFIDWFQEMDKKTGDAELLMCIEDKEFIEKHDLFRKRTIYWNGYLPWNGKTVSSISLATVPELWSVSELAITFAIYLGYEKIYLLGFDHDWFNGPLVYFYDEQKDHKLKPNKEVISFADSEFQMARHAKIFKKYKCLYSIKKNIYNANHNAESYLDVFPKVSYEGLFNREKTSE